MEASIPYDKSKSPDLVESDHETVGSNPSRPLKLPSLIDIYKGAIRGQIKYIHQTYTKAKSGAESKRYSSAIQANCDTYRKFGFASRVGRWHNHQQ